MLGLINHILRISPRRDRTEINAAMVDALTDFFHPSRLTIYRCYPSKRGLTLFACAGFNEHGKFLRNAYLPERHHCHPLDHDRLHHACVTSQSAIMDRQRDGTHRIIFPVFRGKEAIYLLDLTLSADLSPDQRVTMMGLIEYFGNHIALLDYGETDTLTNLASRKTFDKHLFELLGHASCDDPSKSVARRRAAHASSHWIAVCDIDHFKQVNDNFGHLIGDEVLVSLAHLMRQSFRFDDQLFRFGGEEFIALLQPTTENFALATLERFRQHVEKHSFWHVGKVTISIGFSALRLDDSPSAAIDRADEALYYAKRHGRNRVECYERLLENGLLDSRRQATEKTLGA